MSATKFWMTRDINGFNGFGLPFSNINYSVTLTASTDTTLTIPENTDFGGNQPYGSNKWLAIFEYDPGTSTWIANGATASNPAGSTFAATTSQLNPAARIVTGGDILHFYSTGTGVNVSVELYSLS